MTEYSEELIDEVERVAAALMELAGKECTVDGITNSFVFTVAAMRCIGVFAGMMPHQNAQFMIDAGKRELFESLAIGRGMDAEKGRPN